MEVPDNNLEPPLSQLCIAQIKKRIGREWFVFISSEKDTNYFQLWQKSISSLSNIYTFYNFYINIKNGLFL